jgi:hypothetical protein
MLIRLLYFIINRFPASIDFTRNLVGENIINDILFIVSSSSASICTSPIIDYGDLDFNFDYWTVMSTLSESYQTQTVEELLLSCEEGEGGGIFVTEGGTGGLILTFIFN